jgi:hypothetical protein
LPVTTARTSFIDRSGVGGEGAAEGAAAKLGEDAADADPGAVAIATVSVVAAEAGGSAEEDDRGGDWLPPQAENDDNPKNTALAAMFRYVQAFMPGA